MSSPAIRPVTAGRGAGRHPGIRSRRCWRRSLRPGSPPGTGAGRPKSGAGGTRCCGGCGADPAARNPCDMAAAATSCKPSMPMYGPGPASTDDPHHAAAGSPPWLWRNRCLLANTTGATRWRQLLLIKAIERVRPRTVVEIGCGNGINLLLLACRFPHIAFTGIEQFTAQGQPRRPSTLPADGPCRRPCRPHLRAVGCRAAEPIADLRRASGVSASSAPQGSATDLPFEDGAFDLAITVLALEQMEQIRPGRWPKLPAWCARTR